MRRHTAAALITAMACACLQDLPAGALYAADEKRPALTAAAPETDLPERYDLREQGLVTRVQDQGSYGMCWSFAGLASLESTLLPHDPAVDLSEWHAAFYTYSHIFEKSGTPEELLGEGGNFYLLSALLTSWSAPVSERLFPFGDLSLLDGSVTAEELQKQAEHHVTDAVLLGYDPEDPDSIRNVKQAVLAGHAVSASYYDLNSCYQAQDYAYYNAADRRTGGEYHAVTLVGWDDTFPAENFRTDPGQDGAWLMKNSWGTDWGDNGYFWMSYAEPSIVEMSYFGSEAVQTHSGQYRHDDYGFWSAFSVEDEDSSACMANVFTAEEDAWLTDVMFCTAMPQENYAVQVYTEIPAGGDPDSGTAHAIRAGSMADAGYHTVPLPQPVYLHKGETFSIVMELAGSMGQHIACEAYLESTTEYPDGRVEVTDPIVTEDMIIDSLHPGESYYSTDGTAWCDFYDEPPVTQTETDEGVEITLNARVGNVCIRGLTQPVGTVIFSDYDAAVPAGTEITLSCPGADEILYSTGGDYQVYADPIVITDSTTLSAYSITDGEASAVCTQQYAIRAAQLSSLLDTDTDEYVTFEAIGGNTYTATLAGDVSHSLLPITTGEILCDTAGFTSGHVTEVTADTALVFSVSQEGMQESRYVIYLKDDVRGDIDLDGAVNASDAAGVLRYAADIGANGETAENQKDADWLQRADYNGSGRINAGDAAIILRKAAEHGAGIQ